MQLCLVLVDSTKSITHNSEREGRGQWLVMTVPVMFVMQCTAACTVLKASLAVTGLSREGSEQNMKMTKIKQKC